MASQRRPAPLPKSTSRSIRTATAPLGGGTGSRPSGRERAFSAGAWRPVRVALTLSIAGLAVAGAAWRAGRGA